MNDVIAVDRVWKAYPRWTPGSRTLKGVVSRRVPTLMRFGEQRWALRDVSFALPPGRSMGLIGHNGAGKSTLLRLIAGLGRPTRGRIDIGGDTAAVLSLGDAVDLSLTGRENAVTAGVIAGLREARARALIPAILEFAELEEYADTPVRAYSEGMKLRLAFGVVAQHRPDGFPHDGISMHRKQKLGVRKSFEGGSEALAHRLDRCPPAFPTVKGSQDHPSTKIDTVGREDVSNLCAVDNRIERVDDGVSGDLDSVVGYSLRQ